MALSNCRECGKQVSTEASACPHCGVPQPTNQAQKATETAKPKGNTVPCKACKGEVSITASKCPHCGQSNPGTTIKDMLMGLIALCVVVAGTVYACTDSEAEKQAAAQAAAAEKAKADAECKKDLQCIGDKASIVAAYQCAKEIEKFAKFEAIWTDGTMSMKVPQFRWYDRSKAQITLLGDSLQFTNGFNARTQMRYVCNVDMSGDTPRTVSVSVTEGRW